jgi:hypothetical protein
MDVVNINNGRDWRKCGAAMAVLAAPVPMALNIQLSSLALRSGSPYNACLVEKE